MSSSENVTSSSGTTSASESEQQNDSEEMRQSTTENSETSDAAEVVLSSDDESWRPSVASPPTEKKSLGACVRHVDCVSGFCVAGKCEKPSERGDPCNMGQCLANLLCNSQLHRCYESDYRVDNSVCTTDATCFPAFHCNLETKECMPRAEIGATCKTTKCVDGSDCYKGTCVMRCLVNADCKNKVCRKTLKLPGFKLCLKQKKPSKPESRKYIIIIVIGSFAILAILGFAMYYYKYRRPK
jgi:hypothetical protein